MLNSCWLGYSVGILYTPYISLFLTVIALSLTVFLFKKYRVTLTLCVLVAAAAALVNIWFLKSGISAPTTCQQAEQQIIIMVILHLLGIVVTFVLHRQYLKQNGSK